MAQQTPLEAIGGTEKARGVMGTFYEKLLGHEATAGFFAGMTDERKAQIQTAVGDVVIGLLASPESVVLDKTTLEDMRRVHRHLKMPFRAYDTGVGLLVESFEETPGGNAAVERLQGPASQLREYIPVQGPEAQGRGAIDYF